MKNNIKSIRKSRGVRSTALADILGTTQPTLSRWERGISPITMDVVGDIAKALNCEPWELLPTEWQPNTTALDDQPRFKRILQSVNAVLAEIGKTVPEETKIDFVFYLYDNGYCRQFYHTANDNEVRSVIMDNFPKSNVA